MNTQQVLGEITERVDGLLDKISANEIKDLHEVVTKIFARATPGQLWTKAYDLYARAGLAASDVDAVQAAATLSAELDGSSVMTTSQGAISITQIDFRTEETYWNGVPHACEVIPIARAIITDGFWKTHPIQVKLGAGVTRDALPEQGKC